MVTHTRLQYYKHNYCLLCITGFLGCRWYRYRQSTRDSRKKDLLLLCILIVTFLYMSFCLYFWLVASNDSNSFNWYISTKFKIKWIPWYTIFLSLTAVVFGYFCILIGLSICHIYVGHQIYIHPIHTVLITITLVTCICFTIFLNTMWPSEWTVVELSFQIVGPFIHIGLIFIVTLLTWILVKQWYILERFGLKLLIFVAYLALLVGVYVLPLFIDSPCIQPAGSLPPKPQMFAHRGASGIAPENTLIAFQIAANQSVYGFESDVRISSDGIPFIMHDELLKRTTNVDKIFPDRMYNDASTFSFKELSQLNAGSWFLEDDPMNVASSLTEFARSLYQNQTIMKLSDLIQLAIFYNKYLMVDVRPPHKGHPYYKRCLNRTIEVILNSGIPHKKIWWLPSSNSDYVKTLNFTQTEIKYEPVDHLYKHNIFHINAPYTQLSEQEIQEYSSSNITTNIYLVNSRWFFSLYWCMGVQSVTTDNCHILSKMTRPIWHFTPATYSLIWISVDVLSLIIITIIFIVQRIRLVGTRFNPETISLHSQQTMTILTEPYHSTSRTMKEKLLFTADQLEEDMSDAGIGVSNDNINSLESPSSHFSSPQRDIVITNND